MYSINKLMCSNNHQLLKAIHCHGVFSFEYIYNSGDNIVIMHNSCKWEEELLLLSLGTLFQILSFHINASMIIAMWPYLEYIE